MSTSPEQLQRIFEAALLVAGRPLTPADLQKLFDETDQPDTKTIREILQAVQESYQDRGIELREVASGFQFQARQELSSWLSRLWEERAPRFTRAFLETTALIAYRQPITRAEIEEIRGVAVSSNIIKTLQEREWVRVLGYRDVPGKPALYGTTKNFLDHLGLKSLDELPPLSELVDLDAQEEKLQGELELAPTSNQATAGMIESEEQPDTVLPQTDAYEHSQGEHEQTEKHPHEGHDADCSHEQDEDAHEHGEHCSHDEEDHEHTDECLHEDDEHDCSDDEEDHEHTDECSHEEDIEQDDAYSTDDDHTHTSACSHDDDLTEEEEQPSPSLQSNEEDDILSDPYQEEETSKA